MNGNARYPTQGFVDKSGPHFTCSDARVKRMECLSTPSNIAHLLKSGAILRMGRHSPTGRASGYVWTVFRRECRGGLSNVHSRAYSTKAFSGVQLTAHSLSLALLSLLCPAYCIMLIPTPLATRYPAGTPQRHALALRRGSGSARTDQ